MGRGGADDILFGGGEFVNTREGDAEEENTSHWLALLQADSQLFSDRALNSIGVARIEKAAATRLKIEDSSARDIRRDPEAEVECRESGEIAVPVVAVTTNLESLEDGEVRTLVKLDTDDLLEILDEDSG